MPELSIITAVYKTEPYLCRCIESILSQDYDDFELILIDDGSPDSCGIICDKYEEEDSRIRVLHQKNQGVSAARNAGLEIAQGVYYLFIDSDDWVEPGMFFAVISAAKKYHAEMVICGANYCDGDGLLKYKLTQEFGILDRETFLKKFFYLPNPIGAGCCNKLFYAPKIRDMRFSTELALAEDWFFVYHSFVRYSRALYIPECYYNIREGAGSATRTEDVNIIYRNIMHGRLLRDILHLTDGESYELRSTATDKYLDDCVRYSNRIRTAGKTNHQPWVLPFLKLRLQMATVLPSVYLKHLLPKSKRHRYLYEFLLG